MSRRFLLWTCWSLVYKVLLLLDHEYDSSDPPAFAQDEPESASPAPSPKPKLPSFQKIKRSRSPSDSLVEPTSSPAFPLATTTAPRPAKIEEDDDEAYARKLQAEYAALGGGRTTRNGGTSTARRGGKKKSKARVSDDSGDEDDGGRKKKKRKTTNSGFNKLHVLSDEMAEVCGRPVASRPGVTKVRVLSKFRFMRTVGRRTDELWVLPAQYLWRYIKAHGLQDPNKKTDILPDEKLKVRSQLLASARNLSRKNVR